MPKLDELDRDIIRALQQDGRRSNVEIARDLGVAESTVRKRLERLLEEQTAVKKRRAELVRLPEVCAPQLCAELRPLLGLPLRRL